MQANDYVQSWRPEAATTEETITIRGEFMGNNKSVQITQMPINKIHLGKNSRKDIRDDELAGLMQSIKETGLLQPIGVTQNGKGYQIIYGNRRYLACSKLGMRKIPAIIHEENTAQEIDLKNLTENIQRRNISLMEAGRYIDLLEKEGLTHKEIAVRLGVAHSYVSACKKAFLEVPKEFAKHLEIKNTSARLQPGKIAVRTANAIINAAKNSRLSPDEKKILFKEAKTNSSFRAENIAQYARQLKSGNTNFVKATKPLVQIAVRFFITEDHKEELEEKYVRNGQFRSLHGLFVEILKGTKSVQIKAMDKKF